MGRLIRTPWITYGIVYIYRRKFGFYLYKLEWFEGYWMDGPFANPPLIQHMLSAGTAFFIFVPSLAIHLLLDFAGMDVETASWLFSYLYTFSMTLLLYHLAWMLAAAVFSRTEERKFWRWTSSLPSELAIVTAAAFLST